jgi:hypothetical protein
MEDIGMPGSLDWRKAADSNSCPRSAARFDSRSALP